MLPAFLSPAIACLVATVGTWLVFAITRGVAERYRQAGFRWGQIGSASLVSLAHGTNDAQKTMGVITLALLAAREWHDTHSIPFWVKVACAVAIAIGTYMGGWRIIRTLGKGLVEISAPQGMAAETSSAATILVSSHLGFALSTTHVATGSILGSGLGRPGAEVRWGVAGRMMLAWLVTLPAAGVVGAATWWIAHLLGPVPGSITIFVLLVVLAGYMFVRSLHDKIDPSNVNDDWVGAPSASRGKVTTGTRSASAANGAGAPARNGHRPSVRRRSLHAHDESRRPKEKAR